MTSEPKDRRRDGFEAEKVAVKILEGKGWKIVETNFQTRLGEIDIIARDGVCLVFVEVKSAGRSGVSPQLRVNKRKQDRIILAATKYLQEYDISDYKEVRFDVVAMSKRLGVEWEFLHLTNAFVQNIDI